MSLKKSFENHCIFFFSNKSFAHRFEFNDEIIVLHKDSWEINMKVYTL